MKNPIDKLRVDRLDIDQAVVNVTRGEVAALRAEAAQAGDTLMVAICDRAAGEETEAPLSDDERRRLDFSWPSYVEAQQEVARCLTQRERGLWEGFQRSR